MQGFTSELDTRWLTGEEELLVLKNFGYIDKRGVFWDVPAESEEIIVDGASIPPFLRSIAGHPFDPDLMKGSVIHDRYCVTQSRSQRDTHRVLREAWEFEGLPGYKAWPYWSLVRVYNRIKNRSWK